MSRSERVCMLILSLNRDEALDFITSYALGVRCVKISSLPVEPTCFCPILRKVFGRLL